jgi:hypothetical protein
VKRQPEKWHFHFIFFCLQSFFLLRFEIKFDVLDIFSGISGKKAKEAAEIVAKYFHSLFFNSAYSSLSNLSSRVTKV